MDARTFFIIDVFAEEPLAGNQLAVFPNAGAISSDRMLALTREFNFSETAFVLSESERDGGWDTRIFTPGGEVPFAGHPTLGTALLIREELTPSSAEEVRLNLALGQIPVTFRQDPDGVTRGHMRQQPPTFGAVIPHEVVAPVLGLLTDDLDPRFPAQQVSTGLPFLIVPVRDLAAVRRARLDARLYEELIREHDARTIFFFCPETYAPDNQINARMFAPDFGVPEDPATGSANGCLAGYLVEHEFFGTAAIEVRVEQGYEIGRPSLLYLRAWREAGDIVVEVGGRAFIVARGEWC